METGSEVPVTQHLQNNRAAGNVYARAGTTLIVKNCVIAGKPYPQFLLAWSSLWQIFLHFSSKNDNLTALFIVGTEAPKFQITNLILKREIRDKGQEQIRTNWPHMPLFCLFLGPKSKIENFVLLVKPKSKIQGVGHQGGGNILN